MTARPDHLRRIARQHLETIRLLGGDLAPVPVVAAKSAAEPQQIAQADAPQQFAGEPALFGDPSGQGMLPLGGGAEAPPELAPQEKPEALEALRARHDAECPHCTTATSHTQTVFGEGAPDADLMFIGEAPGEEEDRTGRPFVGRAGRKLDEIIGAMGLRREDVYIANILKSRPPGNRTPLPGEVDGCSPFLAEQIRIIRPLVVVALGGPAAKWLLRTSEGITRLRGKWAVYTDGSLAVPVMPTFHTAYLLRNYTMETRSQVWSDMQAVMAKLARSAG
jgi:DNA polymerase